MDLFKGYVETKNKKCMEKFKGRTDFKTVEQVQSLSEYAGILADDIVLVDIDDTEQAEILMDIVEEYQLDCRVYQTTRGRHFVFKNKNVTTGGNNKPLPIGLHADIKVGRNNSYEILKYDGRERFIEWDIEPDSEYQELPKWLTPIKYKMDFLTMKPGDGRNQALFNYILTLQSNGFTVEECRETIRIINKFALKEPLDDDEIETILRDDSFKKPIFFNGNVFLFNKFAAYLVNACHVIKINHQLHIYYGGIYVNGYREIETAMITHIPDLKKTQRREVIEYMELITPEVKTADERYIAFRNGIYDVESDALIDYTPNIVVTNGIPWDYNPNAYSDIADKTLNKLACQDKEIRLVLEECIGYCFYRRNEMRKSFMLTGGKRNGKSTFLDMIKTMLGEGNISALDLKELGDRFSTSMMFGKLANIGDDIGDDFLQGNQVAVFKKITAGNRVKAERKGQDPFEFNPYIKLLFSANDIPRMKDKTGAVLDRMIIIPFDATFSKTDPDYDPYIKYKLTNQEAMEYLIQIGVSGLHRVLENKEFTSSIKVQKQVDEYEIENNPITAFLADCDIESDIENEATADVYKRYGVFCVENAMQPMGNVVFSKQICKRLDLVTTLKKINGKGKRVFVKED